MTGWLRSHVPKFAQLAKPLTSLTKKNTTFTWTNECQEAFEVLREQLVKGATLTLPDFDKKFSIECDASDIGLGSILVQTNEQGERQIIEYASRMLKGAKLSYTTTEKELLSVIYALKKFRGYFGDAPINIVTDHQALKWLLHTTDLKGRLTRWSLIMQEYNYTIEYKAGSTNIIPDALSRATTNEGTPQDLELDLEKVTSPPPPKLICPLELKIDWSIARDLNEIKIAQKQDQWLSLIKEKIIAHPKGVYKNYVLIDDVVYYKNKKDSEPKIVIPGSWVVKILKIFHDSPAGGHLGRAKTIKKIQQRVYWHKMEGDIKKYLHECKLCQLVKLANKCLRPLMQNTIVSEAMELVGVDLMGAYPRSKRQNRYLLVFVDYYSKWVEIYPLRTSNTATVARHLLDLFCRYGVPKKILSDNGPQFISKVYTQLTKLWGAKPLHTTRYHAQTNATERTNQIIKHMIQMFIDEDHREWDRYIPQFAMALRTSPHCTTGYTPARLFLNRELRMPIDNVLRESLPTKEQEKHEKLVKLDEEMKRIKEEVERKVFSEQKKQKYYYDKRAKPRSFEVGDIVRVKTFNLSNAAKGIKGSFCKPWKGPCTIKKKINDLVYELTDETGKNIGKYNIIYIDKFITGHGNGKNNPKDLEEDPPSIPHSHAHFTRSKAKAIQTNTPV